MQWELYSTILNMEHEGYPPDAILATLRSRLEADCRAEDDATTAAERAACERADRQHLAAAIGTAADPFTEKAA